MKKILLTLVISTLLSSGSFAQVAIYTFNDGNAKDEIDNVPGLVNGATLTTDRFGNSNHAYFFDGVDDYINFGDKASFKMGSSTFAISLWIKTDSIVSKADIIGKKDTSSANNYNQYSISFNNSKWLIQGAIRGDSTHNSNHQIGTNNYDTTGWNHIVMVYSIGCTCTRFYVNNQLVSVDTENLSPSTFNMDSYPLVIGQRFSLHDFPFKGAIDDIVIFKKDIYTNTVDSLFNVSNPLGIEELGTNATNLNVYPNPVMNVLQFSEQIGSNSTIKVFDLAGKPVISIPLSVNKLDVSNLKAGAYFFRISSSGSNYQGKFIKQ